MRHTDDLPGEPFDDYACSSGRGSERDQRGDTDPGPPLTAGASFLSDLAREEAEWMKGMVASVARKYSVDRDDLAQEMNLALLTCDVIDSGRAGVHSWLRQRANWLAAAMLRRELRGRSLAGFYTDPIERYEAESAEPAAWSLPRWWGLSREETQLLFLVSWYFGLPLRDIAEVLDCSYSAARQRSSRTFRKIEDVFALQPEERAALIAYRGLGSVDKAAARLRISPAELRTRVRSAEHQIRRVFRCDADDASGEGTGNGG